MSRPEVLPAPSELDSEFVLSVTDLAIVADQRDRAVRLVEGVSIGLRAGSTLGLVGESGSGKTVTAMAIGGLLPPGLRVGAGAIHFEGRDLAGAADKQLQAIRGAKIGFVFQDPQNSLDPAFTVGDQLTEAIRAHRSMSAKEALEAGVELLNRVGIEHARKRVTDYPHQFSGGMAQRVMIAIAICCSPRVLIADEPTTALDVTVQAQILELLLSLKDEYGLSLLLISHDLGVIAEMADEVAVMYAGQIIESGRTTATFAHPEHPYTAALMAAQPQGLAWGETMTTIPGSLPSAADMPAGCRFRARCAHAAAPCESDIPLVELDGAGRAGRAVRCVRHDELHLPPVRYDSPDANGAAATAGSPARSPTSGDVELVLDVRNLGKEFPLGRGVFGRGRDVVRAVDDVSFQVPLGTTLGLVGESGAGKSTVGRLILGLTAPTGGSIIFQGAPLAVTKRRSALVRRQLQVVFQNPYASLDPMMTVADIVAEPIDVHRRVDRVARRQAVVELLEQVGLDAQYYRRHVYQMSGGQLQRVAIARALALNPALIVCDEPISSLDVSTQAQVINLLKDSQARLGMAYLFIGHNLAVVSHISDRLAIMYRGRIVEIGDSAQVYHHPKHPYTQQLLSAVLSIDPRRKRLRGSSRAGGSAPDIARLAGGCPYVDRCPKAMDVCRAEDPPEVDVGDGTTVRCHLYRPSPAPVA